MNGCKSKTCWNWSTRAKKGLPNFSDEGCIGVKIKGIVSQTRVKICKANMVHTSGLTLSL